MFDLYYCLDGGYMICEYEYFICSVTCKQVFHGLVHKNQDKLQYCIFNMITLIFSTSSKTPPWLYVSLEKILEVDDWKENKS